MNNMQRGIYRYIPPIPYQYIPVYTGMKNKDFLLKRIEIILVKGHSRPVKEKANASLIRKNGDALAKAKTRKDIKFSKCLIRHGKL